MEDTWCYVEEDDSSRHSFTDSDKIDSETEAELYSKIHYEENLSNINFHNSKSANTQDSELSICTPFKKSDRKRECVQTLMNGSSTENQNSNDIYCLTGEKKSMDGSIDFKNVKQNSSPPKKLKSNNSYDSNSIEKLESVQNKSSKIQKKKSLHNSKFSKTDTVRENNSVIIDSSDSDNDIWSEPISSEKSDFKINIVNSTHTIYVSSDSDNEIGISPLMKRDSILRNLSMPNIKMGENLKGQWHINNEDLYRKKKHSQRYHENIDVTCSNCNRRGHVARICPSPRIIKCFVCGGEHFGARCINRMCSNCYGLGHDNTRCRKKMNTLFCHLCNMQGHIKENCPDLWRRYHLTTKPVKIKKGKQVRQNTNLYCWNCGKGGHFGGVCPVSLSSRNFFSTWPCVISYDNPNKLLKRRLNGSGNFGITKSNKSLTVTPNISQQVADQRRMYIKPANEINKTKKEDLNEHEKPKYTSRRRTDLRFTKVKRIITEQDFPRTPKKKSPNKSEGLLELRQMKKIRKNQQRNMNRKLKRRKKLEEQRIQQQINKKEN